MDRKRIKEEILEILCAKLHNLPTPADDPEHDFEGQRIRTKKGEGGVVEIQGLTDNQLDIAEVAMDLEDAFGFNFDEALPGDDGLETIGKVIDHITAQVGGSAPAGQGAHDEG